MKITRVGLDIAKQVFQVHGIDERGKVGVCKQLARAKVLEFFAQLPRSVKPLRQFSRYRPFAAHVNREPQRTLDGFEQRVRSARPRRAPPSGGRFSL
jgi:transposase